MLFDRLHCSSGLGAALCCTASSRGGEPRAMRSPLNPSVLRYSQDLSLATLLAMQPQPDKSDQARPPRITYTV